MVDHYTVQETWNEEEDQDLREYLKTLPDATVEYKSAAAFLELQINDDLMLFADSSLEQQLLCAQRPIALIVESYPPCLDDLYKREIQRKPIATPNPTLPVFVKLQGSNKEFASRIIRTNDEWWTLIESNGTSHAYVCQVVDFDSICRSFWHNHERYLTLVRNE